MSNRNAAFAVIRGGQVQIMEGRIMEGRIISLPYIAGFGFTDSDGQCTVPPEPENIIGHICGYGNTAELTRQVEAEIARIADTEIHSPAAVELVAA